MDKIEMDQSFFLRCEFVGALPDGQDWSTWLKNNLPIGFYQNLEISFRDGHICITGKVENG